MSGQKAEKKGTMLSLERGLVEKAKALGLNMSLIMNETLRYLIEHGTFQPANTELVLVDNYIEQVEDEIQKHKELIDNLETHVAELKQERARIQVILDAAMRDTEIAQLYQRLSDVFGVHGYEFEKCWAETESIREALKERGLSYGEEEFKVLIERLRAT